LINYELEDAFNESMLYYPEDLDEFLGFPNIATKQQADQTILALLHHDWYKQQECYGTQLVYHQDEDNQWWIDMSENLIEPTFNWYHAVLAHIGMDRLLCQYFHTHFWIPNLMQYVEQLIIESCAMPASCQCYKMPGPGLGHLLPHNNITGAVISSLGPGELSL
jgi:hypothetical protein